MTLIDFMDDYTALIDFIDDYLALNDSIDEIIWPYNGFY